VRNRASFSRPEPTEELENGLDANLSKEEKLKQLDEEFSQFMQVCVLSDLIIHNANMTTAPYAGRRREVEYRGQSIQCRVPDVDAENCQGTGFGQSAAVLGNSCPCLGASTREVQCE